MKRLVSISLLLLVLTACSKKAVDDSNLEPVTNSSSGYSRVDTSIKHTIAEDSYIKLSNVSSDSLFEWVEREDEIYLTKLSDNWKTDPNWNSILVIPAEINGKPVRGVGRQFQNIAALKEVVFPDSITELENSVFADCKNLSKVILPKSLIKIGDGAFFGCTSLTSIEIPPTVEEIGTAAFYNTGITNVVLPKTVKSIGDRAFGREIIKEIDLKLYAPYKIVESDDPYNYKATTGLNPKLAVLSGKASINFANLKENQLPHLDGSTAFYPLYAAFVQAVYPDLNYWSDSNQKAVECSTTRGAFDKMLSGEKDIIFCYKPSEEQTNTAKYAGVKLVLTPIGKDAFVFVANANNTVSGLTVEQIKDIYSGKITEWSQVGGNSVNIVSFQRSANSGSQTIFESIMQGVQVVEAPRWFQSSSMGSMLEDVASYTNFNNAIGYSFRFYTNEMVKPDGIKLLAINGIAPTNENIRNGTYPFTEEFYAVTRDPPAHPEKAENVQKFIDWILSDQGQELVEKTGYVGIR